MASEQDHFAVCSECGLDRAVELPDRLIDDCVSGRVVLFVGAGASTESHNVMPNTFYNVIAGRVGLEEASLPFPDLMTEFVAQYSRTDLILEFFQRIQYIETFQDLRSAATKFHSAVGVIPFFREIITTNWDDYFERESGAIPLVTGNDFDYWELPVRKVLKIHGSYQNPGSIIATREEYDHSLAQLRGGALGSTVRHLLATKTVVFVGYSLRDDDIRDVIDALRSDLGRAAPRVYFVHPSDDFEAPIADAVVLRTTASSFVKQLDRELVSRGYLLPMSIYSRVDELNRRTREAMQRAVDALAHHKFPLSIYTHAYQDGILHATQRLASSLRYGHDRARGHLNHQIRAYEDLIAEARRRRDYWNGAYYRGYQAGLIAPLLDVSLRAVPLYYCPGVGEETSFERIAKAIKSGSATHKAAYLRAKRETDRLPPDMVLLHTPFG